MAIPVAVSPGTLTPGVYLVVDLLAGAASASTGLLRVALLGAKSTAGDLTLDTEVRAGGGPDTAATGFGGGTPAHLAAVKLYARYPQAQVDFVGVTPGAGLATLDLTFTGTPTGNNAVDLDVMGREFSVGWLTAETPDEVKANVIAAINERADDLFVIASDGGVGVVTIDAKATGNEGNDVKVTAALNAAATGTEAVAGAATPTNLVGGTTDPDYATGLSSIDGKEYARILTCLSNTDVANTATKNNFGDTIDHINLLNTGLNAFLQEATCGLTTTIAAGVAASVNANGAANSEIGEMITCVNGRGLPAELAGAEVGGWLAATSLDPAANRIGEDFSDYIGAVDVAADRPSVSQSEQAIGGGLSLISYTAQDQEALARAVTTHSQTATGAPDRRLLDIQNVSATYVVSRDIRDALPLAFPNAKITKDTAAGDDPPPKGVVEERDVKAWVINRLRTWQVRGVVLQSSLDTAIANGTLIVEVSDEDSTQVNIVLPFSIVPPLAKFGVVAQRIPN